MPMPMPPTWAVGWPQEGGAPLGDKPGPEGATNGATNGVVGVAAPEAAPSAPSSQDGAKKVGGCASGGFTSRTMS